MHRRGIAIAETVTKARRLNPVARTGAASWPDQVRSRDGVLVFDACALDVPRQSLEPEALPGALPGALLGVAAGSGTERLRAGLGSLPSRQSAMLISHCLATPKRVE